MNKEFISYEQAVALKELGFDERCFTRYYESGKLADSLSYLHHNHFGQVNAPTFSQTFRWFREKHNLNVDIFVDDNKTFGFMITHFTSEGRVDSPVKYNHITYEESEQACLDRLVEIVKNKYEN